MDLFSMETDSLELASIEAERSNEMSTVKTKYMCVICLEHEKMTRQCHCKFCLPDVRGAVSDAKRQGPAAEKAFKALRAAGGVTFREAMLVYRARCAGYGRGQRRLSFHWVRYEMCIQMSSSVQKGSKCIWMSRGYFLEVKARDEELTELEALQEFENQWESLPSSRKQGKGKARRILWPLERFVYAFNARSQIENTIMGTKDRR